MRRRSRTKRKRIRGDIIVERFACLTARTFGQGKLLSQYSTLDVPWKSDEEATVRWILERNPEFFSKQDPFHMVMRNSCSKVGFEAASGSSP